MGAREKRMQSADNIKEIKTDDILKNGLDPTFLFTWKGTRTQVTETYHAHDYIEMAYVMSGDGKYKIEDEIYDIHEGDLLVFNPGVHHQAVFDSKAEVKATEFFIGFCDVSLKDGEKNYFELPQGGYIMHTGGELKQKIFRICSSMGAESAIRWQGRYYMLKAYLMQLLLLIVREEVEPPTPRKGYSFESVNKKYVVEQVVSYFEDHYSEKISLDTIAENTYMSPFYISRVFKSETGDTPIHHLIKIRLEKALELLKQDDSMNIQEIAARVGYDDAYHFSKLFKKHFGVSPSKAKQLL